MKMMMTEKMTKNTRDIRLLRSSRDSFCLLGGEVLVMLFIDLLPYILAKRISNHNAFYLYLRGNDSNCKVLEQESIPIRIIAGFSIPMAIFGKELWEKDFGPE
jgi:hypothetical protein